MFDFFDNLTTLNCVYFAMVVSGLIFAVALLLLGEFGGDGADAGADVSADVDGGLMGDMDLQIFSPITLATFITVFGATGLICTIGLDVDDRVSLIIAFVAGAIVSLVVALIYSKVLVEMHGTTEIRQADMIGVTGQVTVPIPPGGLGEVRFEIHNELMSRPARSSTQAPIARGTAVVIEEIAAGAAIVRPKEPAA